MKLRPLIFWPHLIAGTAAGLVILLMAFTGVLLTYERQLVAWADSQYRSVAPAPGAKRLPVDEIVEAARSQSGLAVTAVVVASDAAAPVTLTAADKTLFADAYSGALLGEGSQHMRRFMSSVRGWHRWLAVDGEGRAAARAVTGWANLLFAFIVLSGFYLWIPRVWRWPQVRAVLLFKRGATSKARDFNWHNVIGFWSAVPLFIVVVSAVPISFQWANAAVYRAVGETPPAGRGGAGAGREAGRESRRNGQPQTRDGGGERRREREGGGRTGNSLALDLLLARAERQVPGWRTINLRLPESSGAPVVFNIDAGSGGQPHLRSTLTVDGTSGAVVSFENFSTLTLGRRIRNVMRFAHTGEVLGLPGQTVAGLVSAGAVVLVWTGLALALRRCRAWLGRRVSRPDAASPPDRTAAVA
ncbi:MAG TPA: PepSY-associated TM helix domain-containing protein [Vicinamibacterales bacterium]|nr:PepSY-associated TM helix domain-containing protein [Vicinamibacterales bacterium]